MVRSIDPRPETLRSTQRPYCSEVAELFGTRVAETILASVHIRAHQKAGHMDASDLTATLQTILQGGGPSTYGSRSAVHGRGPEWPDRKRTVGGAWRPR
jgi:hypothetical protein